MSDTAPIVKIQDPKEFKIIVVSSDRRAASLLFPSSHEKLCRFEDIKSISSPSELLDIYASNTGKKLVVCVETNSETVLIELKKMIYGAHAEKRGLLFGFSFESVDESDFERLIYAGFDDVFELRMQNKRQYNRLYSWIRRFADNSVSSEDSDRDVIARLGNKKDRRIGKWIVAGNDMAAHRDDGKTVSLTRQEIDFLTLLSEEPDSIQSTSYEKLFKAPHAIVHKLKKKLGSDLPIQHNSSGRYCLLKSAPGEVHQ
jgi:hypothetical protein